MGEQCCRTVVLTGLILPGTGVNATVGTIQSSLTMRCPIGPDQASGPLVGPSSSSWWKSKTGCSQAFGQLFTCLCLKKSSFRWSMHTDYWHSIPSSNWITRSAPKTTCDWSSKEFYNTPLWTPVLTAVPSQPRTLHWPPFSLIWFTVFRFHLFVLVIYQNGLPQLPSRYQ